MKITSFVLIRSASNSANAYNRLIIFYSKTVRDTKKLQESKKFLN